MRELRDVNLPDDQAPPGRTGFACRPNNRNSL